MASLAQRFGRPRFRQGGGSVEDKVANLEQNAQENLAQVQQRQEAQQGTGPTPPAPPAPASPPISSPTPRGDTVPAGPNPPPPVPPPVETGQVTSAPATPLTQESSGTIQAGSFARPDTAGPSVLPQQRIVGGNPDDAAQNAAAGSGVAFSSQGGQGGVDEDLLRRILSQVVT